MDEESVMIITAATANVYLNPYRNINDSGDGSETTTTTTTTTLACPLTLPHPPARTSYQQHTRKKSRGVSLHGGGMTMSIIELMHHIVREPAPRLPEGRFEKEAEEFVDACLEKEIEMRKTPGVLLVSFFSLSFLMLITEMMTSDVMMFFYLLFLSDQNTST